jgi:hypothetical protein
VGVEDVFLPVARPRRARLRLNWEGGPVWPVAQRAQQAALEEVARLFQAKLKWVEASEAKPSAAFDEIVVALGQKAERAARLYAHLTGRNFIGVRRTAELRVLTPSVVVTDRQLVSPGLLELLYQPGASESAPGLICGSSEEELLAQALIRSAASVLCAMPVQKIRVDIRPAMPFGRVQVGATVFLGKASRNAEIREALGSGAGVLNIITHSDGVDADLGSGILCPLDSWSAGSFGRRPPACVSTNTCHRKNQLLDRVRGARFVISPCSISARILLWQGCFGVLFKGSSVDPAWGLLPHFLRNPSLGAFLASWGILFPSAELSALLINCLLNGYSLGQALAFTIKQEAARAVQFRLCLFGDPRLRLPVPRSHGEISLAHHGDSTSSSVVSLTQPERISFLRAYLSVALQNCSPKEAKYAREALAAVLDVERATGEGQPTEGIRREFGPRMRQSVLRFLSHRGSLPSLDWMRLAHRVASRRGGRCRHCGEETVTLRMNLSLSDAPLRILKTCSICGIIEDRPNDSSEIFVDISNGTARWGGQLPTSVWDASLLIDPPLRRLRFGLPWPKDASQMPKRHFRLPDGVPQGPFAVAIAIIWRSNFAICRVPVINDRNSRARTNPAAAPFERTFTSIAAE